jgi:hypothetical protein
VACAACSPSAKPKPPPAAAQCAVDVWIDSWNNEHDGSMNEQLVMTEGEHYDRIEGCDYADAIRRWADQAPPGTFEHAKPDSGPDDWDGDVRVVLRVVSSRGTDLIAIPFFCDWVRRNKKDILKFDPSLMKLVYAPLSERAKKELSIAQEFGDCAFGAPRSKQQ